MATDTASLLASTVCYECTPPGQWQLMRLGLLKQILLASNPVADTSANALLASAKCYECMPPGIWMLLELGLLKQIADSGGVGGGVACGAGAPMDAPATSCSLYIDTNDGTLYEYYSGSWH